MKFEITFVMCLWCHYDNIVHRCCIHNRSDNIYMQIFLEYFCHICDWSCMGIRNSITDSYSCKIEPYGMLFFLLLLPSLPLPPLKQGPLPHSNIILKVNKYNIERVAEFFQSSPFKNALCVLNELSIFLFLYLYTRSHYLKYLSSNIPLHLQAINLSLSNTSSHESTNMLPVFLKVLLS